MYNSDKPLPLPVQALDHATGYLIAATVVRSMTNRIVLGTGTLARLSLARTAKLLIDAGMLREGAALTELNHGDLAQDIEQTGWGPAHRVLSPVTIQGAAMRWDRPANKLRSAEAAWIS